MHTLLNLDSRLLLFINHLHSSFLNNVMFITSSIPIWIPLYLAILYVLIKNLKYKCWLSVLAMILVIILCDRISSGMIKPFFERFRPTHDPYLENMVTLVNGHRGGLYGFVSSHAANTVGLAMLCTLIFRNKLLSIFMFSWAIIVSYSRVYLGLHFPGDVTCGAILGAITALVVFELHVFFAPYVFKINKKRSELKKEIAMQFSKKDILLVVFVGILSFVIILLCSHVLI